jgi:hypothetical protein
MYAYCDSCLESIDMPDWWVGGEVEYLAELTGMGLLPDHFCDRIESNGDGVFYGGIDCDCMDH